MHPACGEKEKAFAPLAGRRRKHVPRLLEDCVAVVGTGFSRDALAPCGDAVESIAAEACSYTNGIAFGLDCVAV